MTTETTQIWGKEFPAGMFAWCQGTPLFFFSSLACSPCLFFLALASHSYGGRLARHLCASNSTERCLYAGHSLPDSVGPCLEIIRYILVVLHKVPPFQHFSSSLVR
jgi:hypothetical protein